MRSPRIVLVGSEWFADLLVCCQRALVQLGAEVSVVATNRLNWMRRAERLRSSLGRLPIVGPQLQGRLARKHESRQALEIRAQLQRVIAEWQPDLLLYILCWGEQPVGPEMLDGLAVEKVGWLMDDPFQHDGRLGEALPCFDRLYVVEDTWIDNVRLASGRHTQGLTCGADQVSSKIVLSPDIPEQLRSDVLFIGKAYRGHPAGILRRNLLERVADLGLKIYGDPGWARDVAGHALANAYQGRQLSVSDANLAYNGAAISLNIHYPQFYLGTSLRTFAIAAAGAFQLVDERPGLSRFLVPGKEVVTYSSPGDLRDKVLYYLKHDAAREEIARAGYARVQSEHTYAHRLRAILDDAGLDIPTSQMQTGLLEQGDPICQLP